MGWFMPPFMKIQTPWTEQEGKAYLSVTKKTDFPKLNLAFWFTCNISTIDSFVDYKTPLRRQASDVL
jgi:hypothetical protein